MDAITAQDFNVENDIDSVSLQDVEEKSLLPSVDNDFLHEKEADPSHSVDSYRTQRKNERSPDNFLSLNETYGNIPLQFVEGCVVSSEQNSNETPQQNPVIQKYTDHCKEESAVNKIDMITNGCTSNLNSSNKADGLNLESHRRSLRYLFILFYVQFTALLNRYQLNFLNLYLVCVT